MKAEDRFRPRPLTRKEQDMTIGRLVAKYHTFLQNLQLELWPTHEEDETEQMDVDRD